MSQNYELEVRRICNFLKLSIKYTFFQVFVYISKVLKNLVAKELGELSRYGED
jgi:hypothetical protein